MAKPPKGRFPGENPWKTVNTEYKATGEFRPPRAGEFYLSGAIVTAYKAPNDFQNSYWIAEPIALITCSCCKGTGKVERGTKCFD